MEGEKGNISRCGQHIANGDATADDTHYEGYYHQYLVATDGCFLVLLEILYGIHTLGKRCHEASMVREMGLLCEEEFL